MGRARRIAQELSSEPAEMPALRDIQTEARRALDGVFSGIEAVLGSEAEKDAADELGQRLAVITRLKTQLEASPRRRPLTAVWDGTDHALANLDTAADLFVQALCEAAMRDAQRVAAEAQGLLDAATGPLTLATSATEDLAAALEGSSAQLLGFLAHRTALRGASPDGHEENDPYAAFVDEVALADDHLEYVLAFEDERARLLFDRARFWDLALETYRQLKDSQQFQRLLEDDAWRQRFLAASDQLADVGLAAEAMAEAAYHERQLVRADLETIKTLLEGPAKTLLRTRLSIHRGRPFAQVDGYATAIVDQVQQSGMKAATLGLRKDLRHAISHEDFYVDQGTLVLNAGKPSELRIERDELVDEVLAALESTLAMHTAITVLLWRSDEELAGEAGRRAISSEQAIWLCFRLVGYDVVEATIEGGEIFVVIADPFDSRTLATIASLTWLLPVGSETLEVASAMDGRLVGPLSLFRDFSSETDEWQRDLRLWEILTTWHWNDEPVAGPSLWRCWMASVAVRTSDDDPRAAIGRIRDLRGFAEALGDLDLVDLMGLLLRFHRHRITRSPMAEGDINRMMGRLRTWAARPTQWPKVVPGNDASTR